jgi:putative copper resistance protein D
VGQWSLFKKVSHLEYCWPELLKRFSLVAFGSVALLIMAGAYLYFQYVGNYLGLIGTAYGTMLLTKVTLMSGALLLGVFNFAAIQQWRQSNKVSQLYSYTPYIIETEAIIGIIILFAAAAFTSQPPAIDVVNQRSSPKEVLNVFVPKIPQWVPASMEKLNANISSTVDPYAVATPFDKTQSNFNHNISGIFVILLGLGALLQRTTSIRSMRHWPLLFFPFWLFLLVFAQPTGWPLGKRGFIESLWAADVLQHRLGTLFVVVLGVFEWRVQTQNSQKKELRSVFPILCFLGGALLLSHSHSLFPDKSAYLIEVSHNAIGILAVLIGAGSWLELRLSGYISRIAGYFWPICFMLLGYVLFVYKEL